MSQMIKKSVTGVWVQEVPWLDIQCPYCYTSIREDEIITDNSRIQLDFEDTFDDDINCPKCKRIFRLVVNKI